MTTRRAFLLGSTAAVAAPTLPLGADEPVVEMIWDIWANGEVRRYVFHDGDYIKIEFQNERFWPPYFAGL